MSKAVTDYKSKDSLGSVNEDTYSSPYVPNDTLHTSSITDITIARMDTSIENHKRGKTSPPIDLSDFE